MSPKSLLPSLAEKPSFLFPLRACRISSFVPFAGVYASVLDSESEYDIKYFSQILSSNKHNIRLDSTREVDKE